MEEVRSGRIPYTKLDVPHRRMLDMFLPRFGVAGLSEDGLWDLTRSWHRLDGWPDVATAFPRLGKKFLLAPFSNGNISHRIINQRGACIRRPLKRWASNRAHDGDTAGAANAGLRTATVSRPDEFGPGSSSPTPKVPVDIIAGDLNDLADKLGAYLFSPRL